MTGKLRRVLIAARFRPSRPDQPTPEEIHAIRLAWEDASGITAKVESSKAIWIRLGGVRTCAFLGAATTIMPICPFPRCTDIVGTADAHPRIAGMAVRSLSCGSAWSV